MLFQLLRLFDALCIFIVLLSPFLPQQLFLVAGAYLIIKGGIFLLTGDKVSALDIFSGIFIFLLAVGIQNILIKTLVLLYLLQKTIISFFY